MGFFFKKKKRVKRMGRYRKGQFFKYWEGMGNSF